jgi:ABC-type uncharacterized transport system permease subunit
MSEFLDYYLEGGLIMWFTLYQSMSIIMSAILIILFIYLKKHKFIIACKILLFSAFISTTFAYHIHILMRIDLLNEYVKHNRPISRDIIVSGNDQTLIFPNFEIWIFVLILIFLVTVYILENLRRKSKMIN